MPGAQLDFRIKWNSPELVFMGSGAGGVNSPKFRIVPFSPKIHIRHMDANNELHIHNESQMLTQQRIGIFPHFGRRLVTHTFVDGRRKGYFHNVFQGSRPNYMILGFTRGAAINGSYAHSPFNFRDMLQSSIRVTVDGEEIPYQRIELGTSSLHKEEGFNTLLQFSGKGIDSAPIGISREGYKDGNYLILLNFNPDGEQNFSYNYNRNVGNVNVEVDFSNITANNTTMVAYGLFEQEMWVDGHKNISLRYNY
jgi:hypothetical protein